MPRSAGAAEEGPEPARASTSPIERLRDEARRFPTSPYLLTVTGSGHPHCSVIAVDWGPHGNELRVPAPRGWSPSDAHARLPVTLLWPPEVPGGYSLIVDGVASAAGDDGALVGVTPTRAVLHRPGRAPDPKPGCGSDCMQIIPA